MTTATEAALPTISVPTFSHGQTVRITNKRSFSRCTFGSVVGCAMRDGRDPIEAIDRARRLGHPLHWLNADCMVIDGHCLAPAPEIAYGDLIQYEGLLFRVERPCSGDHPVLAATDIKANSWSLTVEGVTYRRV